MQAVETREPPWKPSDEATFEQLTLAREQGDALNRAVEHMTQREAHGMTQRAGDYIVGVAIEKAEGLYHLKDGNLVWQEPDKENCHIEVVVQDGADYRFIPQLSVIVTVIDANGDQVGVHQHPFLWHPWLYHYGMNWAVPGNGDYTIKVHIDAPDFMRHDKINGQRYAYPVDTQFNNVTIETGQKR